MIVKINAGGRAIEIHDCHNSAEECAGIALELWQETEPVKEELGGATGIQTEREYRRTGFVDVSSGESLDIR
jgi:hypothetical protein